MNAPASLPHVSVRLLYANVYLLSSPAGRLVVDAGAMPFSLEFAAILRQFKPDALLVTHAHVDHAGGAWVASRLGVPVLAHPLEHPQLTGEIHDLPYPAGKPQLGKLVSRAHLKVSPANLHAVHPGEVVSGWEVVHLPGHTPGQIGVLRGGVLVAADAVVSSPHRDGSGGAHLPKAAYNADHRQALKTLKHIANQDLRAILPGHGHALKPEQIRKRAVRDDKDADGG